MDIHNIDLRHIGFSKETHPGIKEKKNTKPSDEPKSGNEFTPSDQAAPLKGYNPEGQAVSETGAVNPKVNAAQLKLTIQREIRDQTYALLKQFAEEKGDGSLLDSALQDMARFTGNALDPLGLASYFAEHPQDWEKVQSGGIPNYFNVENTAQRILNIWAPYYNESEDIEEWLTQTKNLIGQAYDEVSQMVGGLPQLVQDTRAYVMNALEEFAAGYRS